MRLTRDEVLIVTAWYNVALGFESPYSMRASRQESGELMKKILGCCAQEEYDKKPTEYRVTGFCIIPQRGHWGTINPMTREEAIEYASKVPRGQSPKLQFKNSDGVYIDDAEFDIE